MKIVFLGIIPPIPSRVDAPIGTNMAIRCQALRGDLAYQPFKCFQMFIFILHPHGLWPS